jgi:pilus assembly protein TadC
VFIHTDADGQYLASDIPRLIKVIENDEADLAMGSRFMGKIEEMPLIKRWGNQAFSRVISKITRVKISDGQSGFRAFTKEVAEKITITSFHTYTQEQIIRAARLKFRIKEIPIFFAKRGGKTKSRLMSNPFDYALKAWINILRIYRDYEPLKFFGMIGLGILGVGFFLGLYLVYLYITRGMIGRIPLVMLDVLIIMLGVQVLLFAFYADMDRK